MIILDSGRKASIHGEKGFTVLESTLVIIIIGMLAVIALPKIMKTNRRVAEITTQQITADMRYARILAITKTTGQVVKFVSSGSEYTAYGIYTDANENGTLDAGELATPVKYVEIQADEISCIGVNGFETNYFIYFTPLGSIETDDYSSGEIIHVSDGTNTNKISVVVATGRVFFN